MQPFRWTSIVSFATLMAAGVALAVTSAVWLAPYCFALGEYRSIAVAVYTIASTYGYAICAHRLLLHIFPLAEGPVTRGTAQQFHYQVYSLFYLILFNSLIRSRAIPIPLMRLIYQLLGARLGLHTHTAGILFDPSLIVIGENTLVGESALLVPHVIEGAHLAHYRIAIGSNVTIGAYSVVLAGATIGHDAVVAANSVVTKGSCIPPGEIWGGSPARPLRPAPLRPDVELASPASGGPSVSDYARGAHRA